MAPQGTESAKAGIDSPKMAVSGQGEPSSALRSVFGPLSSGFSLVEVIIAAGIFAASVTVVLALLPSLARQGAASVDSLAAQRLTDALKVELARQGAAGFDALAGQVPVMSGPLAGGLAFVADREATRLHSLVWLPPPAEQLAEAEQYFLVECWRFPDEPLRFEPTKGFMALMVRVSWPHRLPGAGAPVAIEARQEFLFTTAINR